MAAASAAARPGLAALNDPPASVARPPQSWLPAALSSADGALPYSSMLTSLAECASCARDVAAPAAATPRLPSSSSSAFESGARSWTSGKDDRTLSMGDQQPAATYAADCSRLPSEGGGGSHGAGCTVCEAVLTSVMFAALGSARSDGLRNPVSTTGAAILSGAVLAGTAAD